MSFARFSVDKLQKYLIVIYKFEQKQEVVV